MTYDFIGSIKLYFRTNCSKNCDIHFQRFDTAVERFSDRSEIFQRFKLAVTDRMSKLKRSSEYTQILRMN